MSSAETTSPEEAQTDENQLVFKRLSTWQQIGLSGFRDFEGPYFITNLSAVVIFFCSVVGYLVFLNSDVVFNLDTWDGNYTQSLGCEAVSTEDNVLQPINAASTFGYIFAAILVAVLGWFDVLSWRERNALWKETHLITGKHRKNVQSEGNPRNSVTSNSRASTQLTSRTTFSVEHEEITVRRRFNEYLMGKSGTPSLCIRQPIWSAVLALSFMFLGLANLIFHASLTNLAKRFADFALWIAFLTFVAYAWSRYTEDALTWLFCWKKVDCRIHQANPRRSSLLSTLFFLSLAAVTEFFVFLYLQINEVNDFDRGLLTIGLILFSIPMFLHYGAVSSRIGSSWMVLIAAIFFLIVAYVFEMYDAEGEYLCLPDSNFQGTAGYHILNALGMFLLYLFFRSDHFLTDLPIDEENSPRLVSKPPSALTASQNLNLYQEEVVAPRTDVSHAGLRAPNPTFSIAALNVSNAGGSTTTVGSVPRVSRNRRNVKQTSLARSTVSGVSGKQSRPRVSSPRVPPRNQVQIQQMWTCSSCGFTENYLDRKDCVNCGQDRPDLDTMVAVPLRSSKMGQQPQVSDPGSKTGSRIRRSRDRAALSAPRPNSKLVGPPGLAAGSGAGSVLSSTGRRQPKSPVSEAPNIVRVTSRDSAGSRLSRGSRTARRSQHRSSNVRKSISRNSRDNTRDPPFPPV